MALPLRWKAAKDPSDVVDYDVDWSRQLVEAETIDTSGWTLPAGFTKLDEQHTDTKSKVWLSGGAVGTHDLVNTITTTGGRTLQRSVRLVVAER